MTLRFFFDAGSGVCLWAHDAEARERFGYPVESEMLDIPQNLRDEIEQLIADYDEIFPWQDPGGGGSVVPRRAMSGHDETPPFGTRVRALLPKLRLALGADFTIESALDS